MKKIISLILVMMIMVAALFAGGNSDLHSGDNFKELIPLEENPRIKYKGYSINILYESMKRNSLAPFKDNNLAIDYSSAYSDVVYDLNDQVIIQNTEYKVYVRSL